MPDYRMSHSLRQESPLLATHLRSHLLSFLAPLLRTLDQQLDRRLVTTFVLTIQAIELTWRYSKSELAIESPRVWTWERRAKLLWMLTLAYAFLLSLLDTALSELRNRLLRAWCHRTGKRSREIAAPLYRLRSALSRLWQTYPGSPTAPSLSSG